MGKYVDWYLVELERMLKGSIRPDELASTLTEVEAHLYDLTEGFRPQCQHGEDPELLAIDRFGKPDQIAMSRISANKVVPLWRIAWWNLVLVILMLIGYEGNQRGLFAPFMSIGLVALSISIVVTTVRTKRVQTAPVAAGCFVMALLFAFSGAMSNGAYANANEYRVGIYRIENYPHYKSAYQNDIDWLTEGIKQSRNGFGKEYIAGNKVLVGQAVDFSRSMPPHVIDGRQYYVAGLKRVLDNPEHALKWWKSEAPEMLKNSKYSLWQVTWNKDCELATMRAPFAIRLFRHLADGLPQCLFTFACAWLLSAAALFLQRLAIRVSISSKAVA